MNLPNGATARVERSVKVRRTNPLAAALSAAVLVLGLVLLILALFHNRHRYDAMAMAEFYDWSRELHAGGNPWLPVSDPGYQAIAGVPHRGQCNYPPAFLVAFAPLTFLPLPAAFWLWQAILVGSLFAALVMLVHEAWPRARIATYAAVLGVALLFPEVYGTLYESEPTLLLLALVVGAFVLDRRERAASAGFLLALAALLKLFPALLGGYFLARRRWPTIVWMIAFGLAGLLLARPGELRDFLRFGVMHSHWMANDQWLRNARSVAVYANLRAFLDALNGGELRGDQLKAWLALTAVSDLLIVAITVLLTYRTASTAALELPSMGLWLCAMILVSPIAWGHYFPLIFPAMVGVVAGLQRGYRLPLAGGILIGAGLLGIYIAYFSGALRERHLLFIAAIAIFTGHALTLWRWREQSDSEAERARLADKLTATMLSGEGPLDYLLGPPARLLVRLSAGARLGLRIALTLPLLPPPQKN